MNINRYFGTIVITYVYIHWWYHFIECFSYKDIWLWAELRRIFLWTFLELFQG